jgi:hypothetical protein
MMAAVDRTSSPEALAISPAATASGNNRLCSPAAPGGRAAAAFDRSGRTFHANAGT